MKKMLALGGSVLIGLLTASCSLAVPDAEPQAERVVDAESALACLAGDWEVQGPQLYANISASRGEQFTYHSGRYVLTFLDDGTFDSVHADFAFVISQDDGDVRVSAAGSEQGMWNASALSSEELDIVTGVERPDARDLPYISVETVQHDVSETGHVSTPNGEVTVPYGNAAARPGIDGIGPVDCASGTMTLRSSDPEQAWDVPLVRL